MVLPPNVDDITAEHLQSIVESGVTEKREIEFKRELDLSLSKHKETLVAEVSSFANSAGGDLLIGVPDPEDVEDKEDEKLWWITDYSSDDYKLRIEDTIRGNTEPQLVSYDVSTVSNPDGDGFVVIVRIRPSPISPHAVTSKSGKPFYGRSSSGKYQLDVEQLREKFIEQYELRDEIEQFLTDRIAKIRSGNTPAPFEPGPTVVLHMIPASAFSLSHNMSFNFGDSFGLRLFTRDRGGVTRDTIRRNVDGVVSSRDIHGVKGETEEADWSEYTQIFMDGRIEATTSMMLRRTGKEIGFWTIYETIRDTIPEYVDILYDHGVSPPIFVYLTFLDAKGYGISHSRGQSGSLDRQVATLPVVTIESDEVDGNEIAKSILRKIWHAFGNSGDAFEDMEEP